ncbi:hypothetical protein BCR42DRAFT_426979, partial [Absidia repens]
MSLLVWFFTTCLFHLHWKHSISHDSHHKASTSTYILISLNLYPVNLCWSMNWIQLKTICVTQGFTICIELISAIQHQTVLYSFSYCQLGFGVDLGFIILSTVRALFPV